MLEGLEAEGSGGPIDHQRESADGGRGQARYEQGEVAKCEPEHAVGVVNDRRVEKGGKVEPGRNEEERETGAQLTGKRAPDPQGEGADEGEEAKEELRTTATTTITRA